MKRLHLFELEDLPWFPVVLRDCMTDFLAIVNLVIGPYDPCLPLLEELLGPDRQVVDLCAGAGGPWERWLRNGFDCCVLLTDRYPNVEAFERLSSDPRVDMHRTPVDATAVPSDLRGVRTLFTSLHHFAPEQVKSILADAVRARQPIAAFDFNQRELFNIVSIPAAAWAACWTLTPLVTPFRWSRLLFTYVLPAIPIAACWDGFVSQLRAYTVAELEEIVSSLEAPGYRWKVGQKRWRGIVRITYLTGTVTNV